MTSLPHALVLGPQRAGTTWIHQYLASRADVCLPPSVKETFFFDQHFQRGSDWYRQHFRLQDGHRLAIEVASTYFQTAAATRRVADTLDAPVLLCTLRDPAERAYSLHRHLVRYGVTRASLREAFETDTGALRTSSCYATNMKRWLDAFGEERIRVLFLEDLRVDATAFAKQVAAALGLPMTAPPARLLEPVNAGLRLDRLGVASIASRAAAATRRAGGHRIVNLAKHLGVNRLLFHSSASGPVRLSLDDRAWLIEKLRPEIQELSTLLGDSRDLSAWTCVDSVAAAA